MSTNENDVRDDILVFEDDEDGIVRVQIVDTFFYNGDEYAIVTELPEGVGSADEIDDEDMEIYFMQVVPVDEENVEYVPVEDEELSDTLFDIVNSAYDDEDGEDGE